MKTLEIFKLNKRINSKSFKLISLSTLLILLSQKVSISRAEDTLNLNDFVNELKNRLLLLENSFEKMNNYRLTHVEADLNELKSKSLAWQSPAQITASGWAGKTPINLSSSYDNNDDTSSTDGITYSCENIAYFNIDFNRNERGFLLSKLGIFANINSIAIGQFTFESSQDGKVWVTQWDSGQINLTEKESIITINVPFWANFARIGVKDICHGQIHAKLYETRLLK